MASRVSPELGNRIIEGIQRTMNNDPKDMRIFTDNPKAELADTMYEKLIADLTDKQNYDLAHKLDLEVPVVYYRGLEKIVIGVAKITSGGVADIMIGGFDGEDFGNVLHPDALYVSIGLQQPMRWMPEMRINSIKYPEEIYENLRRLRELEK